MNLRDLHNNLLRDLKRSWAKSALLAVLLVVGMVLWLPPVIRTLSRGPERTSASTSATAVGTATQSATPIKPSGPEDRGQAQDLFSWTSADEWLRSDPAAKPAEMSLVRKNPFRFDRDQFAPPILFEAEPPPATDRPATGLLASAASTTDIKGAVLTSTIVSSNRRAALINDRMYNEGSEFKFEGQTFAVERIFSNRVKLTQEGVVYYLTIPSRYEINP